MSDVVEKMSSWAVPSKADEAAWERMTRDEQLAAYRELASHPDTNTPTEATVAEIVERARQRRAKRAADDRKL